MKHDCEENYRDETYDERSKRVKAGLIEIFPEDSPKQVEDMMESYCYGATLATKVCNICGRVFKVSGRKEWQISP